MVEDIVVWVVVVCHVFVSSVEMLLSININNYIHDDAFDLSIG